MAPVEIALRDGIAAAVRTGPAAGLLPLAATCGDIRSALPRSLATECILRIQTQSAPIGGSLRWDRVMGVAHGRLGNGPRPATVVMAISVFLTYSICMYICT
jgi:hypothetical protein